MKESNHSVVNVACGRVTTRSHHFQVNMEGPISGFGLQFQDLGQELNIPPPHLRQSSEAYRQSSRFGPPISNMFTGDYISKPKSSSEDVRGHFGPGLDGIADIHDQEHGDLPLSSSSMGESYLSATTTSYGCSSQVPNSIHPYSITACNPMSQEAPMPPDGVYHRDIHGGTFPIGPDFSSAKGDGNPLRLHPGIPSIPLQAQKPPNNYNIRNLFHGHNVNSAYSDGGASMYNYYHQTSEPKIAHLYPPRPYPAYNTSSAFEPPETSVYAESQCYSKNDSKNLGGFPSHRGSADRAKQSNSLQGEIKEIEDVDDSNRCKNTVEGTKTSVRRFKKWYKDKTGKSLDMNSLTKQMAVDLLKDFFLEIRDTRPGKEGNEYEPVTLTTYRNGLRRYFLERKCPPALENFDLADREFDVVNYGLVTKRNELKRKGKGNHPNVVESITEEQLGRMWASGAIGVHAPRPLLRLQWWINTVCHGIRGRMAHHDLSIDDFRISRGADGKIVIDHVKAGSKRQRLGPDEKDSQRNKKRCKARVAATDGGERDPVRAFEVYLRHRPPGISSFYLTPKHKPKGDIWFNKVPMGKNSIGRIMREIKAIAGIG